MLDTNLRDLQARWSQHERIARCVSETVNGRSRRDSAADWPPEHASRTRRHSAQPANEVKVSGGWRARAIFWAGGSKSVNAAW